MEEEIDQIWEEINDDSRGARLVRDIEKEYREMIMFDRKEELKKELKDIQKTLTNCRRGRGGLSSEKIRELKSRAQYLQKML